MLILERSPAKSQTRSCTGEATQASVVEHSASETREQEMNAEYQRGSTEGKARRTTFKTDFLIDKPGSRPQRNMKVAEGGRSLESGKFPINQVAGRREPPRGRPGGTWDLNKLHARQIDTILWRRKPYGRVSCIKERQHRGAQKNSGGPTIPRGKAWTRAWWRKRSGRRGDSRTRNKDESSYLKRL